MEGCGQGAEPVPWSRLRAGGKIKRASKALQLCAGLPAVLPLTPSGHEGRVHREHCLFLAEGTGLGVEHEEAGLRAPAPHPTLFRAPL